MSLSEAVYLVLASVELAIGGEVFVTKMPCLNIYDLAEVMIDEINKQCDIKIIGPKPGEKFYEELMTSEEVRRTIELNNFFSILPAFVLGNQNYDYGIESKRIKSYSSEKHHLMSKNDIKQYLIESNLL